MHQKTNVKWQKVLLHEVAEIERNVVEPSAIISGTKFVGLENIETGGEFANVRHVLNGELASSKFAFTDKHVLYGKLRPYLAKIARPTFSGICSTDILPILPGANLDRDYLSQFLRQPSMIDLANSRATGANLPRLSPKVLAEFSIPLPPIAEQKRIAAILDKAEELRSLRRKALAELDAIVQSIFLEMFGDPLKNPNNFPIRKLRELCSHVIDCPHSTPIYASEITPYACVRSSDIQNSELTFSDTKYIKLEEYKKRIERGVPQQGDVVYCREGARFGNAALITDDTPPICLGQRMMLFRPEVRKARGEFIWGYLSSPIAYHQALREVGGSASPHINIRDITAFQIPVPPLDRQCEFAQRISAIKKLKHIQRESLAQLDALFASLQHRAFQGEL